MQDSLRFLPPYSMHAVLSADWGEGVLGVIRPLGTHGGCPLYLTLISMGYAEAEEGMVKERRGTSYLFF